MISRTESPSKDMVDKDWYLRWYIYILQLKGRKYSTDLVELREKKKKKTRAAKW